VPGQRFVRDDHRDGAGALGRHGESISTINAIVDKSVRGLVGGWVRAESRCHVVSEPHSDTQELCSRSSLWLNVYGSVPTPSSAFTSEPSWGIEGEDPALYNARTPETGAKPSRGLV